MALVVVSLVSVILLYALCVTKRTISLFEGIIVWCLLQLLQNAYYWLLGIDFNILFVSTDGELYLSFLFNRTILVPVALIYGLELAFAAQARWQALLAVALNASVLVLVEAAEVWLGVVRHSDMFKQSCSFGYGCLVALLLYAVSKAARTMTQKDVKI